MADVAQGVQSSCCGTFSTVAGSLGDEQLSGSCQRCGKPITAPNPQYDASKVVQHWSGEVNGTIHVSGIGLSVSINGTMVDLSTPATVNVQPAPAQVPQGIAPDSEAPPTNDGEDDG